MPNPLNPIVLSENFFAWGFRTKFFRQLVALALTGVGAYLFFPLWWETEQVWYVIVAGICLPLASFFGLLVARNLVRVMPKPGRWVTFGTLLIVGVYAYSHASYPASLNDPLFWTGFACMGVALVMIFDVATSTRNNLTLSQLTK